MNIDDISTTRLEQLIQLQNCTWDGNLISKMHRDMLVDAELVQRAHGFNFITAKGVEYLYNLGFLKTMTTPN